MRLECEGCRAPLRAEDVRFDLALAKCHMCGAVYDLAGRKTLGDTEVPRGLAPPRPRAACPSKLREEEDDQGAVLSWRWFRAEYLLAALVCLVCDGMVAFMYAAMFMSGTPLFPFLFTLPFLCSGISFTYLTLAGLLNTTRIEVRQRELTIRHGPLPWPGNRTVPGHEITQLYCRGGHERVALGNAKLVFLSPETVSYSLLAIDRQGRQVRLLSGIKDKELVLYLEQALERQLGIEDEPVAGELAERMRGM